MPTEFNIIEKYFTRPSQNADLSVGDDAALIQISVGHQLAISADMSVAGTHFLEDCPAYFIGWKSLAVNISDMAAMGATPKWATLAIALPKIDESWLSEFSRGFLLVQMNTVLASLVVTPHADRSTLACKSWVKYQLAKHSAETGQA